MIRFLLLSIIFLTAAACAAIAFTPLGFVLDRSGLSKMGAGWAQSEGTLLKGRVSGLHVQGQMVGDVSLKLRPMSLLSLSPTYDVQWGGAGGRGTGVIALKGETLVASEIVLQQKLTSVEGLAAPVRAIGGDVRLDDGAMTVSRAGCEAASGTISTDALSKAAAQYGRQFGTLSGPLACADGKVLVDLMGRSEAGDRVNVAAQTSLLGQSNFEVEVETQDGEVRFLLAQIGFVERDGLLTYAQSD